MTLTLHLKPERDDMPEQLDKTLSDRIAGVAPTLAAATMLAISALAFQQAAMATPNCHMLACSSASDCGSLCFCNTPSKLCFEDA